MSTLPPQVSREGSYKYTVTLTERTITDSGERVTSTTTNKVFACLHPSILLEQKRWPLH